MLHALLTWFESNQTAAKWAGTDKMNVWLTATNVWPMKVIQNRSGLTLNTFIQEPIIVPIAPIKTANLRPWNRRKIMEWILKKSYFFEKKFLQRMVNTYLFFVLRNVRNLVIRYIKYNFCHISSIFLWSIIFKVICLDRWSQDFLSHFLCNIF